MIIKKEYILKEEFRLEISPQERFVLKSFLQYGLHRLNSYHRHTSGIGRAIRNNDYSFINKIIEKL